MSKWISYHVFYHNSEKNDALIEVIAEKAREFMRKKLIDKWFFLRYWEGGPHLRIRFLNPSQLVDDDFVNLISEFIKENPNQDILTKEEYYRGHRFDGEAVDIKKIGWHLEGEIKNYIYQPEYDRYGGKSLIENSETIFMWSSDLVEKIIKGTNSFEMKLIYSSAISLIILEGILEIMPDFPIGNFLEETIEFWSAFELDSEEKILAFYETNTHIISKVIDGINEDANFKFYLDKMLNEFHKIQLNISDKNVFASIVGSQLHMMNNRMGISPSLERATLKWINKYNLIKLDRGGFNGSLEL